MKSFTPDCNDLASELVNVGVRTSGFSELACTHIRVLPFPEKFAAFAPT